jgi:hypothetical protein
MHRLHFFGSFSLCTAVLSLAACDNGGGVVPIEQLPARIAPSYCALFDRCENPFITQYLFLGGACEDSIEPLLEDSFIGRATEAIRAGTVVYHGELVSSCLAALDASGCSVDSLGGSTCTEIFTGTVSAGGDCNWDEECVAGYCSTSDGMCPGTCAARIAEGGTCNGAGCEPGALVRERDLPASRDRGAAVRGARGEPPCSGIDLTCVGSSSETAGTCTAWSDVLSGGVGAPCNVPDDLCDEGPLVRVRRCRDGHGELRVRDACRRGCSVFSRLPRPVPRSPVLHDGGNARHGHVYAAAHRRATVRERSVRGGSALLEHRRRHGGACVWFPRASASRAPATEAA